MSGTINLHVGSIEEMGERYRVELHAYALMGNDYHLLIRTPDGNASAAIQWLNVSYSVWFNKKRNRVGHVFQGRFGSVLVEGEGSWALNASVYIHLNPVRRRVHGLGKSANKAEALGLTKPAVSVLKRRLKVLRLFEWSSYRVYAGYVKGPEWLKTDELLKRAGGENKYRRYVQKHVTRGVEPDGFEDLAGRIALGTTEFRKNLRKWVGKVTKEQPGRKALEKRADIDAIVRLVEKELGEKWSEFSIRHGDCGRELVLYLARKRSGLTLSEIGRRLGGLEYKTVGKAVQRFEASLARDATRRRLAAKCLTALSLVET